MPPAVLREAHRGAPPPRPGTPTPTPTPKSGKGVHGPTRLTPRPLRLSGVDLQLAEAITHRLLHHAALTPVYHLPLPPSTSLPPHLLDFLDVVPARSPDDAPPVHTLHPAVDPAWRPAATAEPSASVHAAIPPARSGRKRAQLRFLVSILASFLSPHPHPHPSSSPLRVHDLCAGCGHVGILLAALFPHVRVTLVDDGPVPLRLAASRAKQAALSNLETSLAAVQAAAPPCDVVVALHACGGAAEAALARAVAADAALLVVVPCCVGGVVAHRGNVTGRAGGNGPVDLALTRPAPGRSEAVLATDAPRGEERAEKEGQEEKEKEEKPVWTKPRSAPFRAALSGEREFESLLRAADYGEVGETGAWRRVAKACVEWDRLLWLQDAGYDTRLVKLRPESASPKNDVLVAWRRDGPAAPAMHTEWRRDELANGTIADVRERAAQCVLGDSDEVRELQNVLAQSVCADDSPGLYTSPAGIGRQRRKAVHAVADMLGLTHQSVGKGAERVVVVRRTAHWPLYEGEYIGIGGPHVAALAERLAKCVPSELVQRRIQLRGNGAHVTLVEPGEVLRLSDKLKKNLAACTAAAYEQLNGTSLNVFGVGRAMERIKLTEKGSSPKIENEVYFGVIIWPEVQAWRATLGLGHKDLHLTLGFTVKDMYRARKDASSVVIAVRESCSPWVT